MGQRHQFFAIARIRGRYRVVAAVHNQWLCGHSAVRQCLNTMRILRASANFPGIHREPSLAQSKSDDFWSSRATEKSNDSSSPGIGFPFLTTCLLLGCGVPPNGLKGSPASRLPIDTGYNDVQNDDGISVFDVTDVGSPKYAMMFIDAREMLDDVDPDSDFELRAPTAPCTVLTASDYLAHYERNSSGHDTLALDSLPLLEATALNSVWPSGNFRAQTSTRCGRSTWAGDLISSGSHSLKETAMRTVFERGMESHPSDDSWLTEAQQIPGFTESFRTYLYENPSTIHDMPTSLVLGRVLKGSTAIDLSPFSSLSFEGVLAIVNMASGNGSMLSLTLPDMNDLTADGLRNLLSSRSILELHIGNHQIGNLGDLVRCIDNTTVTSFTSPESYYRSFFECCDPRADLIFKPEVGLCAKPWSECSPVSKIPSLDQCCVTQLVYIAQYEHEAPLTRLAGDMFPWSQVIDETFADSNSSSLFTLLLSDSFLSPSRAVEKLPIFLKSLAGHRDMGGSFVAGGLMLEFTQRQSLKYDLTVEPMPSELLAISHRNAGLSPSPFMPTQPLVQGKWTIVICYETTLFGEGPERLRYGFATLDPYGNTRVLDTETFLREQGLGRIGSELEAEWQKRAANLCDEMNRTQREEYMLHQRSFARDLGSFGAPLPTGRSPALLQFGSCSEEEVDEVFQGLANLGRLAPL